MPLSTKLKVEVIGLNGKVLTHLDLEPLRAAIRERHLMERWKSMALVDDSHERKAYARARAMKARDDYIRMLNTEKNTWTKDYMEWALYAALGINKRGIPVRVTKDFTHRRNRGMN